MTFITGPDCTTMSWNQQWGGRISPVWSNQSKPIVQYLNRVSVKLAPHCGQQFGNCSLCGVLKGLWLITEHMSLCLSPTEQQASSAASLHLPHRCVLQRCEERHGRHRLPRTQDPPGLPAQVLKGARDEWKEAGKWWWGIKGTVHPH